MQLQNYLMRANAIMKAFHACNANIISSYAYPCKYEFITWMQMQVWIHIMNANTTMRSSHGCKCTYEIIACMWMQKIEWSNACEYKYEPISWMWQWIWVHAMNANANMKSFHACKCNYEKNLINAYENIRASPAFECKHVFISYMWMQLWNYLMQLNATMKLSHAFKCTYEIIACMQMQK